MAPARNGAFLGLLRRFGEGLAPTVACQKRKELPPLVVERSAFSWALLHARAASFDLMVALMRLGGGAPARSQQVMPAAMRRPMRLPAS